LRTNRADPDIPVSARVAGASRGPGVSIACRVSTTRMVRWRVSRAQCPRRDA
jgi:hypothetical protein